MLPTPSICAAVLATAVLAGPSRPEDPPALTADDARQLDALFREGLHDPTGAARVRVPVPVHSPWGGTGTAARDGWLRAGRVFFTDGHSVPAPAVGAVERVDFLAACRARFPAGPKPAPPADETDEQFARMRDAAAGVGGEPALAAAAWLHRLGHGPEAARALAAARAEAAGREGASPRDLLRGELAWRAFAGLVHAHANRADAEALEHGERLLRLYGDVVRAGPGYRQADAVVADLNRRKAAGTFGKAPDAGSPDEFAGWDAGRKAAWLIARLDEVDARQAGQPGGVDLAGDWRVKALIDLGDPAVPALIDCVAADARLTRSVHFWRDFARSRTVLEVREAALVAAMSVLRVRAFEPVATGDNFTARGPDGARGTAAALRAYWARYGRLPFDERMMAVLTDPAARPDARLEAAGNLAALGSDRTLGTTVFVDRASRPPPGPNPAVAKFRSPTSAEAVLAAMDRDLAQPSPGGDRDDPVRTRDAYLAALAGLGDARIGPALAERARTAGDLTARRGYAVAASACGAPAPMRALAADVGAGAIRLPEPPAGGRGDPALLALYPLVEALADAGTPEADAALAALAGPTHPYRPVVERALLGGWSQSWDVIRWYCHPYALTVLGRLLDDTTPTGEHFKVENDRLVRTFATGSTSSSPVSQEPLLRDPGNRKAEARGRVCDRAMAQLSDRVIGLPGYHPLLRDADDRVCGAKAFLARFGGHLRRVRDGEGSALGVSAFGPAYVPDLRPLGRAATAADVAAGRAVFELGGAGVPAGVAPPGWVVLKADAGAKDPARGLVVQAEAGAGGAVTYGVVFRHAVRAVPAAEVEPVRPTVQPRE